MCPSPEHQKCVSSLPHHGLSFKKVKFTSAKMVWIFLARFVDIILSSICPLILDFTNHLWNLPVGVALWIMIVATFLILVFYFIVVPFYCHGQTLGKMIFRIRLIHKKFLWKWRFIIYRELFIIFIPWAVQLLLDIVLLFGCHTNMSQVVNHPTHYKTILILLRTITAFYFCWFLGLFLVIVFDDHHQFFIDYKNQIFIVTKPKGQKRKSPHHKRLIRDPSQPHVHLQQYEPGKIDDHNLDF